MLGSTAVVLVVAAVLVARGITRPVMAVRRGLGVLARGDLGQQLDVGSGDEIGTMTQAFNAAVSGMRRALQADTVDWRRVRGRRPASAICSRSWPWSRTLRAA